ncbi:MAG TPA: DUF2894 domain-containing protein [Albitalea sp.]
MPSGLAAAMEALRARGAQRLDPVRWRFIEALARRAANHDGEARRLLDERIAGLLAACAEAPEAAAAADTAPASTAAGAPPRSALAELVEHLARQAPAERAVAGDAVPAAAHPPELKALRDFRSTWTRLDAERRLTQSLTKVPENAGPLNSYHLVHRTLALMRDASPAYLERFMAYVDALLWLDHATGGGGPEARDGARGGGERKAPRGKAA